MSEFRSVYARMQEIVRENAGTDNVHFEHSMVVEQDSTNLSELDLLAIPGDEEFVRNCFYKLLGRNPNKKDVRRYVNELAKGNTGRHLFFEKLLASPEYDSKGVKVWLK